MYSVSVVITEDGRPALKLIENRYPSSGEKMNEKYHSELNNVSAGVIIIDLCDDGALSAPGYVIKN